MAAVGSYSSLQLVAGAAILGNVGGLPLTSNACVVNNISTYQSLTNAIGFSLVYGNLTAAGNSVANTVIFSAESFPVLTNLWPTAYIPPLSNDTLATTFMTDFNGNIMGNGNLTQFEQVFGLAAGYVTQQNQMINSVVNANSQSANVVYQNQNNVSTGGLSQITLSPQLFARDVVNLGTAIDLNNLPNLGSPEALLKQIAQVTRISTPLYNALVQNGIPQNTVDTILASNLSDREQKIVYRVMEQIKGNVLTEILGVLRVTTQGLETLADILNPVKAFPNSYTTLTAPTSNGTRAIYIGSTTNVNTNLETTLPAYVLKPLEGLAVSKNTYQSLQKIIPPDQALANKALQAGLETVTSVQSTILAVLGANSSGIETMKGLTQIETFTTPVPTNVASFWQSMANGTGNNGTYLLGDLIGSAAGWVLNNNFDIIIPILQASVTANSYGELTTLYTTMNNTLTGVYDTGNAVVIPGGLPGAGTYIDITDAFVGGLIPASTSVYANVPASADLTRAEAAWGNIAAQMAGQVTNCNNAGISFEEIANVTGTAQGLVNLLPSYGLDTVESGTAWFLESTAVISTQGGQAIVGTMREARNEQRLASASLQTNITVSDLPPVPPTPAPLMSARYTAQESANIKIN